MGGASLSHPTALLAALGAMTGCAGAAPTSATTPAAAAAQKPATAAQERDGSTRELALLRCREDDSDYRTVAEYPCPDGSRPLGGQVRAGADVRVGNVGEAADGHIVDLYEVPCPGGPVRVYVDAYHCDPAGDPLPDPNDLSAADLAGMATVFRSLEADPLRPKVRQLRADAIIWLEQSPQLTVTICPALLAGVLEEDYQFASLFLGQFALSLAAAMIDGADRPPNEAAWNSSAMRGILRMYEALLMDQGEAARQRRLDELLRMRDQGGFEAFVRSVSAGCAKPEPPADAARRPDRV